MGTPVVLISGFTHPTNEYLTPQRVINYRFRNSCWSEPRLRFDHKDFLCCARRAGMPKQFDCVRLITAEQVRQAIRKVPSFVPRAILPANISRNR
jgi:autotransporter strand-loop-strand O-heptosyltransferase